MKYMRKGLFFICFFWFCTVQAQSFKTDLDVLIGRYEKSGGFNGIILIARNPEQLEAYTYGYRNPRTKAEKITLTDPFDLASLSKQFAGLAISQLILAGKIGAEDPIGPYFPELKPALQKVTVRQLANHTNGIHDYYALVRDPGTLTKELAFQLLTVLDTTVFPPGTRWGYSNSGYLLLSILVERLSGMSYEDYCRQHIFNPLGMREIVYAPAGGKGLPGFNAKGEPQISNTFNCGASGLFASGNDLIAYYQNISRQYLQWKAAFELPLKYADNSKSPGWQYAFGWYFTSDETGTFRAHSGQLPGASTYIRWYETGEFICVLSNKNDAFLKEFRDEVAGLLFK